jgi:hypothetical protein
MSTDGAGHVPDLILEQYRLNELPPDEVARLTRCLRVDPLLLERLTELERSDVAIAREYPAGWLAERIRGRVSTLPTESARRFSRPLAFASVFATLVLVLLVPLVMNSNEDRIKGLAPTLEVYRRTPQGSEKLADGAVARAGDLLRVGYISAGREHGVILSIDGRGVVTRHLPVAGETSVTLRKDGTVLLDSAYELDDAPAWERFYFVTADRPFEVTPVLEAARRAAKAAPRMPAALSLPHGFAQSTFLIQKEVKP